MKHRLATLIAAFVAIATLSAAAPASAQLDEMTTEQAGRSYMDAVCIGNDALAQYSRKIWRGRNRISTAEARVRLPQLKREAGIYGRALNKSARMLFNPDAGDWPAIVASDVQRVAKSLANESYWRIRQSNAGSAEAWFRFANRGNKASDNVGTAPTRIRATLDLPPPGEGC